MERGSLVTPLPTQSIKGLAPSQLARKSSLGTGSWITTSTFLFNDAWEVTYADHSDQASPILRVLGSTGVCLQSLLSQLAPQLQKVDKLKIIKENAPYSAEFGLWDHDAFRDYRLHLFANELGGMCRLETLQRSQNSAARSQAQTPSLSEAVTPRTSHDWIQAFDELWPAAAFLQAPDGSLLSASDSLFQFTGRPAEAFNQDVNLFRKIIHDSDRGHIKQVPQNTTPNKHVATNRFRIRHLDTGQVRYVLEFRRAIQGGVNECVWFDVSRETIAEKRLSTAAWKETLGILTVGLAHDFSNILSGIISLSESFLLQVQTEGNLKEDAEVGLKLIQSNAQQATQLVQRIVHLHKGEAVERSYQDLNAVVTEVSQLINKVLPRHIEVQLHRSTEELPIYVDLVELRQVLINLALNAADAMPLGGWIRLSTRRLNELPLYHQCVGTVPKSPIVALEVSDCGHGISAAQLETIFDPFFTTKYHNRGSGLGLYNSKRFIEKQGGAIGVNTKLNEGTTFSILMPEATFMEAQQDFEDEQKCQKVVIAGECREEVRALNETLKQYEFQIVTAQFEDDVLEQIESAYRHQVGVVLLANCQSATTLSLVPRIKRSFPKAKILLVISGCNPDEIPPNIARQADRTVCSDVPPSDLAHALSEVFRE